nr:Uncharacterised protein [Klebsiella pneumoniae]
MRRFESRSWRLKSPVSATMPPLFWMDRASFLLSGFVKGVKVPVYWNYLPAVELMLKKQGQKQYNGENC